MNPPTPDAASMTWRDISTAPKDGTMILYGWWKDDVWHARTGIWDKSFRYEWNAEKEDNDHIGAWTDHTVASWNYEEYQEHKPTHWMPLPPAPTK